MKRMVPKDFYLDLPCSVVSIGCAAEMLYGSFDYGKIKEFSEQASAHNAVVALANIGCTRDFENEFKLGYNEMIKQLNPKTILLFGNKMDLKGNIIYIKCGGFHGKSE